MCGIAAFSLSVGSKVNSRHLAHHLLTQIESRGTHASGFAFADHDKFGVYKNNRPGSQLPLHELPRNAQTVILHTRYATQGSPKDNRNNHPVVSPRNTIAVVHNGVISNDHILRPQLGLTERSGEVDSLVIPALLEQDGIEGLSKLGGYAAIAWVDLTERGMLKIARLKNSPVAFTWLVDGSFVMASTSQLLVRALESAGLFHGGVFELADQRMLSVENGFIWSHDASPRMTYDFRSYSQYSSATAGGHGTAPGATRATTPIGKSIPSATTNSDDDWDDDEIGEGISSLQKWAQRKAAEDARDRETAARHLAQQNELDPDRMSDDDWEEYIGDLMKKETELAKGDSDASEESCETVASRFLAKEGYFIVDVDGAISHMPTLDDLEARLRWLAKMTRSAADAFEVGDEINWINHIWDIGAVDEDGNLISWVEDMAEIDEHESPAVRNLQYVRDGISKLLTVKGA